MDSTCVTKKEAGKLLGVGIRMIEKYVKAGKLTIHHHGKNNATMIAIDEVYNLREEKRKRG